MQSWPVFTAVIVLEVVLIVLGFISAVARCEPHAFDRIGAMITACAAALVVWQIAMEMALETERHATAVSDGSPGLSPIMVRALARAAASIRRRDERHYRYMRLRVAAFVAVNAVLGEIIHGFGDLLVSLARTCA